MRRKKEASKVKQTTRCTCTFTPQRIILIIVVCPCLLCSTLKGVHSLSSLRKKSVTSHTPYSVSFSKNVIVTEYSPDKSGNTALDSSASSLDSFTFSPPRASSAAGRCGIVLYVSVRF